MCLDNKIVIRVTKEFKNEFNTYFERNALKQTDILRALYEDIIKSSPDVVRQIINTDRIEEKTTIICFIRK